MFFCPPKVEKNTSKSCILMAVGRFFFCNPECPKQPRTSFPFYKFFYTIVSAKVSAYYEENKQENSGNIFCTHDNLERLQLNFLPQTTSSIMQDNTLLIFLQFLSKIPAQVYNQECCGILMYLFVSTSDNSSFHWFICMKQIVVKLLPF